MRSTFPEDAGGRLAQPVTTLYTGECGPRAGVSGEALQVDDVAAPLASPGQGRDPQRVDGHVGVQPQLADMAPEQELHRSPGHWPAGTAPPGRSSRMAAASSQAPRHSKASGCSGTRRSLPWTSSTLWPAVGLYHPVTLA